jgi:hypothetical protein
LIACHSTVVVGKKNGLISNTNGVYSIDIKDQAKGTPQIFIVPYFVQ